MFKYIIKGDGYKALSVHTDMTYNEFLEYVRIKSVKIHIDGTDKIFRWGTLELINPKVMSLYDFSNYVPALIGIK